MSFIAWADTFSAQKNIDNEGFETLDLFSCKPELTYESGFAVLFHSKIVPSQA